MLRRDHILRGLLFLAAACLLFGCSDGSVRKVATITSDPPCAKVWLNGVFRGETPIEIPYNWNWFYDIRLEKPGYCPYLIRERFYAPAQHWIPVDLAAELSPVRSYEHQWRHYVLTPLGQEGAAASAAGAAPVMPTRPHSH